MPVDKFGREKQQNLNAPKQQILIPNNLLRTDGTNQMSAELNVGNNDIINVESLEGHDITIKSNPQSKNSLVPKHMLDTTNDLVNSMFDKKTTPLAIKSVSSNSQYDGNNSYGKVSNLIDGDTTLQWIINKADAGKYVFVLLELDQPTRIYKIDLHPRPGAQQFTHTVTHFYLEGSNDLTAFEKVYESHVTVSIFLSLLFNVTQPYKYYRFTCTGKKQFGLAELKLYEAALIPGEKGEKGDQGPRGFTGASGDTLKIDPNGHLTKSSDGLRLSPNYIETKEVKTDLVNVKHITADTANAVGLIIEQGTNKEMRIQDQQITGLAYHYVSDDHAVTKKFLDDALTQIHGTINQLSDQFRAHVESEVAKGKIGHAILTCAGNNVSIGDPLQLRSTYNDIGTLLNQGKLTFTKPGVVKASVHLNRLQTNSSQINLQLMYNESTLPNGSSIVKHIHASIHQNEKMNTSFGFINAKKDSTIKLISNSNIPDIEVFVELKQIYA